MTLTLPLQTPRLVLRQLVPADLPRLTHYRNLPEVSRFQSWDHYTLHDAQQLYAQQRTLAFNTDETWFQLAVERREDGALTGDIGIHFFDDGRQVELGMTFDAEYQNLGYAREAISAIIAVLFNDFARHRLTAVVDTRNIRAVNLLEKLGFRREAHYQQNIFFKGEWGDEYLYALLRSEYSGSIPAKQK